MSGEKTPTISDIAEALGLAPTTVAAALRGEARIAAKTRQRVRDKAQEMGYRRNLAASVLGAQRRQNSQAVRTLSVTYLVRTAKLSSPEIINPIRHAFEKAGWIFDVANMNEAASEAALGRKLYRCGVDAIIWGHSSPSDYQSEKFPWDSFAVLSPQRHRLSQGFDVVRTNHFSSVLRLVRRLQQRGYRHFGVLHREHNPRIEDDEARLAALLLLKQRLVEVEGSMQIHYMTFHPEAETSGKQLLGTVRDWVKKKGVEVIIGFNPSDQLILEEAGLEIPRDVNYAAFTVPAEAKQQCAGIQAPQDVIGPRMAMRLEEKLKLGERGLVPHPIELVITPDYIDAPSAPRL